MATELPRPVVVGNHDTLHHGLAYAGGLHTICGAECIWQGEQGKTARVTMSEEALPADIDCKACIRLA